jgi:hypothetical protein
VNVHAGSSNEVSETGERIVDERANLKLAEDTGESPFSLADLTLGTE